MRSADTLLVQLASADVAVRPRRPSFLFAKAGGMSQTVAHPGLPDDEIACEEADILDLEDAGYLRFKSTNHGIVFDVTEAGRRRAAELDGSHRASAGGFVDQHVLDWSTRVVPGSQRARSSVLPRAVIARRPD